MIADPEGPNTSYGSYGYETLLVTFWRRFYTNQAFSKEKMHKLNNDMATNLPPASTMAGLLLEQTDRTFSTRLVVQSSFS